MLNKTSWIIAFAVTLFFAKPTKAQNCQASYLASKGATIEITEYDANKALKSKKTYSVTDVQLLGQDVASKIRSVTEQGGAVTEDKVISFRCNQNGVEWGVGTEDPKTKKEIFLAYPTNMAPEMALKPDINYELSQTTPDGKQAKLIAKINKRKVIGSESVQVKAGTWECTKISYDFLLKIKVGLLTLPINAKVIEWYNPQVGVVRSETWVKDKKESYSEITMAKK